MSRKINGSFFILPTVNAYQYLTSLNVCDWSGHIFGASASPRSFNKKLAMSPSSAVHGGQHDTEYSVACDIEVANACGFRD